MGRRRRSALLWGTVIAAALYLVARGTRENAALETAERVDLDRYQGRWFEIARLPLIWENKCAADVTATYRVLENGTVEVVNECRKADGGMARSQGTARVVARDGSNARLKVTFFRPFAGDYWILRLDPEYGWALVGTPNRKNLWVLSRTPALHPEVVGMLLEWAKERGFPVEDLTFTRQA